MEQLSIKQQGAIAALVSHRTIEDAAKSVGIGKTTIFRWLQEDTFSDAYRKARTQAVKQAIGRIQATCTEAVDVLREIMINREAPFSVRVTVARTILETSIKAVETEDLVTRIEHIEAHLNNKK